MPLYFPNAVQNGATWTTGGVTYVFDADAGAWRRQTRTTEELINQIEQNTIRLDELMGTEGVENHDIVSIKGEHVKFKYNHSVNCPHKVTYAFEHFGSIYLYDGGTGKFTRMNLTNGKYNFELLINKQDIKSSGDFVEVDPSSNTAYFGISRKNEHAYAVDLTTDTIIDLGSQPNPAQNVKRWPGTNKIMYSPWIQTGGQAEIKYYDTNDKTFTVIASEQTGELNHESLTSITYVPAADKMVFFPSYLDGSRIPESGGMASPIVVDADMNMSYMEQPQNAEGNPTFDRFSAVYYSSSGITPWNDKCVYGVYPTGDSTYWFIVHNVETRQIVQSMQLPYRAREVREANGKLYCFPYSSKKSSATEESHRVFEITETTAGLKGENIPPAFGVRTSTIDENFIHLMGSGGTEDGSESYEHPRHIAFSLTDGRIVVQDNELHTSEIYYASVEYGGKIYVFENTSATNMLIIETDEGHTYEKVTVKAVKDSSGIQEAE